MDEGDAVQRLKRIAELLDQVPVTDRSLDDERRMLVRVAAGYLIPRMEAPDDPVLVAVAGGDGAGKSHLVNGIVGEEKSPEGPIRPTTKAPVVVAGSGRSGARWTDLERKLRSAGPGVDVVKSDSSSLTHMTIVDLSADLDHEPSARVLGLCDMCLVVTTPTRYADATTWILLERLRKAAFPTWVVLNRASGVDDEIGPVLEEKLELEGFHVPVLHVVDRDETSLRELRDALRHATDAGRDAWLPASVDARTRRIVDLSAGLTFPLDTIRRSGEELSEIARTEFDVAAAQVGKAISSDGLGENAAVAPWSEVAERLAGVLTRRVGIAAGRTATAWSQSPDGALVLERSGHELWRHPPQTAKAARDRLLGWETDVGSIVAEHAKRRLNSFKASQVADAVRARSLGDQSKVKWRIRRRLAGGIEPAAEEARARLGEIAQDIVAADHDRFVERLGPRPTAEVIEELRTLAEGWPIRRGPPVAAPPPGDASIHESEGVVDA